jgi:NAD(P)H-hydrate epimerase
MKTRMPVPTVTTGQIKQVDSVMVDEYRIELIQMMENAGRNLANLARQLLDGEVGKRSIVVLAGRGNNGGGGLAAARHLLNWGAYVQVVCSYPPEAYQGVPAHQLAILEVMGAPLAWAEEGWELPPADLLIDAIIGYGLRGDPRGPARHLIQLAQSAAAPILSLDTPSGIDTGTGRAYTPHIAAAATLTLALPKSGFLAPAALAACGRLYLADIGVPPALYDRLDISVPDLFAHDTVVELHVENGQFWADA